MRTVVNEFFFERVQDDEGATGDKINTLEAIRVDRERIGVIGIDVDRREFLSRWAGQDLELWTGVVVVEGHPTYSKNRVCRWTPLPRTHRGRFDRSRKALPLIDWEDGWVGL